MYQRGLSLIELMIAMTISLLMLLALVGLFAQSSQSQRLQQRAAQQIENGRYAMDTITQDIHLAGYYGQYARYADGTVLGDPCITGNAAALFSGLGYPVQGIVVTSSSGVPAVSANCATYLPAANLFPGSDILVVRRADTLALASGNKAVAKEVYLQTNPLAGEIQFGNGAAISTTGSAANSKADGTKADGTNGTGVTIMQRDGLTAGLIRKYMVHVYFVAPCSIPAGGGSICTGAHDDLGRPIPTLKRLELAVPPAGGALTFNTVTIAEGIQALKLEYGIDSLPTTSNASTHRAGDGIPDLYIPNSTKASPGAADYPNAVSVRMFLIARDNEPTIGYQDTKTYPVATATTAAGTGLVYGPYNDTYHRHAYDSEIRLTNMAGRRENP